ncbi:MAG: polyprenyl synthetase family protein [Alphaproteobacteria bacterium]
MGSEAVRTGNEALLEAMERTARDVNAALDAILPRPVGAESQVLQAMRYAALGGGKRLRPFLAVQSGRLFGVDERAMLRVAAAVECVHTYSLVHDDLPAMDDDDMRRGRPSTHREFDEATAILAGDALLTLSFEILASSETHSDPFTRCELVTRLAEAAGCHGMVGGQMIDLAAETEDFDIGTITRLQRMKTGALIAFSCESGAVMGRAGEDAIHALNAYAHDLGLAFQIADDLLDEEGDPELMGKAARKDAGRGKATFVSVLGTERARAQAELLANQAIRHLGDFDGKADLLREVAHYVVRRKA